MAAIEAAEAFELAIEEILVDVLLSLGDLLASPIELVHDLNEARVHSLSKVYAVLVHFLQLTSLSHSANRAIGRVELRSLVNSQVEVNVTAALHVIMLDLGAEEGKNLFLNLVIVGQGVLAHDNMRR